MFDWNRREFVAAGAAALAAARTQDDAKPARKARLKQSACLWCWQARKVDLKGLCKAAVEFGMPGIDLVRPDEWAVVKDHGLTVSTAIVGAGSIAEGLNHKDNHDKIVKAFEEHIPRAAREGVPNVICFFGNRHYKNEKGMEDAEAIDNSIACLNRCKAVAEEHKVTIIIELLNSLVDHADYLGDRTEYGARIVSAVNSPRVKLLYDIYHMQIMEGNVIATIRKHKDLIAHYHTGGVPGRHEIDHSQELYYPAVARAIAETGFTGFVAQEFIPARPDPIQSLKEALAICDV
jgi:hydroxypyruvate isomerase